MPFIPPHLTLRWGAYFKPSADDDAKLVEVATKALDAGLVTRRIALEKIRRVFGIENVDAALEAIEEESAAAQRKFAAAAHAAGPDSEPGDDEQDGDEPPPSSSKPGATRGAK